MRGRPWRPVAFLSRDRLLMLGGAHPLHLTCSAQACCGAGGAAFRWGCMAVASGWHETVVVAGVEAMTHTSPDKTTKA